MQARPPVAARRRANSWEASGSSVVRSLIHLKTQPGGPYVLWDVGSIRPKRQKNDFRDAEAIAEAVQRPYRPHQSNPRLPAWSAASRCARGYGLPRLLTTPPDVWSPRMVRIVEDLAGDWRRLDERVERLSDEIEAIARQDGSCKRLLSVAGVGPIISSATVEVHNSGIPSNELLRRQSPAQAWHADHPAAVVRNAGKAEEMVLMRRGMPPRRGQAARRSPTSATRRLHTGTLG